MNKKPAPQEPTPTKNFTKTSGASHPVTERSRETNQSNPSEIFLIRFLKGQHEELRKIFSQMDPITTEGARYELLQKIAAFFRNHSTLEERHFYPAVSTRSTQRLIEEARNQHKQAEQRLEKLLQSQSFGDDFIEEFKSFADGVAHYFQEEESKLLPTVARELPVSMLTQIGVEMERDLLEMTEPGPGSPETVQNTEEERS